MQKFSYKMLKQGLTRLVAVTSVLGLILVAESCLASPFAGLVKVTPGVIFKDLFKFLDDFVPTMTVLAGGAGALVAQSSMALLYLEYLYVQAPHSGYYRC